MIKLSDGPDRLYIDDSKKDLYEKIKECDVYKDKSNKDLFLITMSYGFYYQMKKSLDKPYGYVRSEYIKEEDWSLIYCLANTVGSVEILNKPDVVFKLAEEYANAGINILHDKIYSTEYGSFEKNLEKELMEMYQKITNRS